MASIDRFAVALLAVGLLEARPAAAAPTPEIEIDAMALRAAATSLAPTLTGRVPAGITALSLRGAATRGARRAELDEPAADGSRRWVVRDVPWHAGRNDYTLEAIGAGGRHPRRPLTLFRPGVAAPAVAVPARWHGQALAAQWRHGHAFTEDDIDLGPAASRDAPAALAAVGVIDAASSWPKVGGVAQVPYVVSQGNDDVSPAIAQYNAQLAGVIQFVPRDPARPTMSTSRSIRTISAAAANRRWAGSAGGRRSAARCWPTSPPCRTRWAT